MRAAKNSCLVILLALAWLSGCSPQQPVSTAASPTATADPDKTEGLQFFKLKA